MYMLKMKAIARLMMASYKFRHWFFQWNMDKEGDIVLSVAGVVHFLKYKEHTIVKWGKQDFVKAPKYVRGVE